MYDMDWNANGPNILTKSSIFITFYRPYTENKRKRRDPIIWNKIRWILNMLWLEDSITYQVLKYNWCHILPQPSRSLTQHFQEYVIGLMLLAPWRTNSKNPNPDWLTPSINLWQPLDFLKQSTVYDRKVASIINDTVVSTSPPVHHYTSLPFQKRHLSFSIEIIFLTNIIIIKQQQPKKGHLLCFFSTLFHLKLKCKVNQYTVSLSRGSTPNFLIWSKCLMFLL